MTELIERLRDVQGIVRRCEQYDLYEEAADEIERLQQMLETQEHTSGLQMEEVESLRKKLDVNLHT